MRSSSFRKSRSNWSDIPSVTATKLKVDAADVIEQAISEGAVAITRHGQRKAVLVSNAQFEALTQSSSTSLEALTSEFNDRLLAGLQKPSAVNALAIAFDATPEQLGAAARKSATSTAKLKAGSRRRR